MKKLAFFAVDKVDHLVQPDEFLDITETSPALAILTDFKHHRPHVVDAHITAAEAQASMLREHVGIKLVVDTQGEFIGLVSMEDLADQRILLTQVAQRLAREEVLVADLMHDRDAIRAISYEEFQVSSVADIIYTLQRHGQQYCIVIDCDKHHIRGLVSSADISRRLHQPVNVKSQHNVIDILSAAKN